MVKLLDISTGQAQIPPGVNVKITDASVKEHTSTTGNESCAVVFEIEHLSGEKKGETSSIMLGCGPLTKFKPSKNKKGIEGEARISNITQFGKWCETLIATGSVPDSLLETDTVDAFVGLSFTAGEYIKPAEGQYKESRMLTVEKVLALPGGKAVKDTKKTEKTEKKGEAAGVDDATARKALVAIVSEHESVKIGKIRNAAKAYAEEHSLDVDQLLEKFLDVDGWVTKNLPKMGLTLENGVLSEDKD